MAKLGAHIVQGSRNGYGQLCTAKPAVVLSTDDGGALLEAWQNSGGHTYTIFRDTVLYKDAPEGIDQMTPAQASALADSIYPTLRTKWAQNLADYYTVLNEPAGNNAQVTPVYFAYELRMMELAEADGLKLCVLNLAGGTPGDFDVWKSLYVPHIKWAFEGGHIYGRHCYGGPKLSVPDGNTNRVFIEAEHLRAVGLGYGGIVITEAGHNGGYSYIGDAAFVADVQAYNAQMMTHPNIIGACLWTLGEWQSPSSNWQTAIPTLSPWIAANPTPKWTPSEVPPPQPPTGYKSVVFKLAQEHTVDEWAGIARIAHQEYKRTMTASGDNCLVMVGDGNEQSYAVVFDPDLPSQVATVQQLTAAGLNYQTRTYRQPQPTNPQIQVTPISQRDPRWANVSME